MITCVCRLTKESVMALANLLEEVQCLYPELDEAFFTAKDLGRNALLIILQESEQDDPVFFATREFWSRVDLNITVDFGRNYFSGLDIVQRLMRDGRCSEIVALAVGGGLSGLVKNYLARV
jgi:hypothetical protein